MRKIAALASAAALTMTLAACSDSSKPTKDEVVTALHTLSVETLGESIDLVGEDVISEYTTCWVDGFYDDVSGDTLNDLVNEGADGMVTEDEALVIQEASVECDSIITDSIIGN